MRTACNVIISMSNGDAGILTMKTGERNAVKIFIDALQHHPTEIMTDENGIAAFHCNAG